MLCITELLQEAVKKNPEGKPLFTFSYLILEFEPIAKTNSLILSIYLDEVVTTEAHIFS